MENYGVISLTKSELISIEGGKPLSYYIGLGVGFVAGTVTSLLAGFKDGFVGKENE